MDFLPQERLLAENWKCRGGLCFTGDPAGSCIIHFKPVQSAQRGQRISCRLHLANHEESVYYDGTHLTEGRVQWQFIHGSSWEKLKSVGVEAEVMSTIRICSPSICNGTMN